MCGICGIYGDNNPDRVKQMVNAMHHRGPDDQGIYSDETITMGMSRLAILDVSQAGHQPMSSANGQIWIVYNGETYNFLQERVLLERNGYVFHSNSDAEVVLKLYEHYGDDFVSRLRGMFALAIYDKRRGSGRERLLLARDPIGIKPLLYARSGKSLVFASEMKALLKSGLINPEIDSESLRLLLTYGSVSQPKTFLKNVYMLPPAHRMIVDRHGVKVERYWSLKENRCSEISSMDYEEQVDYLAATLEEVVQMQMVSDVPVGAFLSGGVDSSILVGFMARAAQNRVKTYSVGFEAEFSGLDETDDAENTAKFLGTDHHHVVIRGQDVINHLYKMTAGLDQPTVDGVNSYFISAVARQDVAVAISGTGGDEIFAGYSWFMIMEDFQREFLSQQNFNNLKERLIANYYQLPFFDKAANGIKGEEIYNKRAKASFTSKYATTNRVFPSYRAAEIIHPERRSIARAGRAMAYDISSYDEIPLGNAVNRSSAICLRGYLNNQLLRDIDAASMAHSLEIRVPFLDVPLIDLALSLPTSSKLNARNFSQPHLVSYKESGAKRILIDAGKKMGLLREGIDQQQKRGFTFPLDAWMRNEMRPIIEDVLSPSVIAARGIFHPQAVTLIWNQFLERKEHWSRPWLLFITELWCREILDNACND